MNEIMHAETYLHDLLTTIISFLSHLIGRKIFNENKIKTIKSISKKCNIHDVKWWKFKEKEKSFHTIFWQINYSPNSFYIAELRQITFMSVYRSFLLTLW